MLISEPVLQNKFTRAPKYIDSKYNLLGNEYIINVINDDMNRLNYMYFIMMCVISGNVIYVFR